MFYSIRGSARPQVLFTSSLAFIGISFDPMTNQVLIQMFNTCTPVQLSQDGQFTVQMTIDLRCLWSALAFHSQGLM